MRKNVMLIMLLVVLMSIAMIVPAFAADDEVITFDEFYDTLKNAYAAEDMGYEIVDYPQDFIFTKQMLNMKLQTLKDIVASKESFGDCNELSVVDNTNNAGDADPYSGYMPVQETFTTDRQIDAEVGIGFAQMRIEVVATVNSQNQDLMSVDSYDCYQIGYSQMFEGWELRSMTATPNYNNDTIYAVAKGIATFVIMEPFGITERISSEYTLNHTFSTKA